MSDVVKRALNSAQNMRGNTLKVIVPKSIEGVKEPRGDGRRVPASWSEERGRRGASRDRVKGV